MDCKVHQTAMITVAGVAYCADPACDNKAPQGRMTTEDRAGSELTFVRVLPRGESAFGWKPLRVKGRCIPCEKRRHT